LGRPIASQALTSFFCQGSEGSSAMVAWLR
jgi:hypothetical protein